MGKECIYESEECKSDSSLETLWGSVIFTPLDISVYAQSDQE